MRQSSVDKNEQLVSYSKHHRYEWDQGSDVFNGKHIRDKVWERQRQYNLHAQIRFMKKKTYI